MNIVNDKNTRLRQVQEISKKHDSIFVILGLSRVENTLQKIPFIGNALPFLLINLLTATIFYYLCYCSLWLVSSAPEKEGQWFINRADILGKSYSRLTTYAAEQIAYFVAGFAACLFTYSNYSDNNKNHFLIKTILVLLIPTGFLIITKAIPSMPVYIPLGFIYGQFVAIVIVCIVKLFYGDKIVKNAKS